MSVDELQTTNKIAAQHKDEGSVTDHARDFGGGTLVLEPLEDRVCHAFALLTIATKVSRFDLLEHRVGERLGISKR